MEELKERIKEIMVKIEDLECEKDQMTRDLAEIHLNENGFSIGDVVGVGADVFATRLGKIIGVELSYTDDPDEFENYSVRVFVQDHICDPDNWEYLNISEISIS